MSKDPIVNKNKFTGHKKSEPFNHQKWQRENTLKVKTENGKVHIQGKVRKSS